MLFEDPGKNDMTNPLTGDENFLKLAVSEAVQAMEEGNAPIGAVLTTCDGEFLARSHNQTCTSAGSLYHAEMLLFLHHQKIFNSQQGITLYTTLEPCLMCLGTALVHHVQRIVWLVNDYWSGGTRCYNFHSTYLLHRQSELVHKNIPVLSGQAIQLLVNYYSRKWSQERIMVMLGEQWQGSCVKMC